MATLTRDQIRAAKDSTVEKVPVPEWGGDLFVKTLSVADIERMEGGKDKEASTDKRTLARALVLAACDEDGEAIFAMDDAAWLHEEKNGSVLMRIVDAIKRVNPGIFATDTEELEKNSGSTSGGNSSSP